MTPDELQAYQPRTDKVAEQETVQETDSRRPLIVVDAWAVLELLLQSPTAAALKERLFRSTHRYTNQR